MISPLLTDLYQLTMAYGYWKCNMHNQIAVFHLHFRHSPFDHDYAIACGLETVVDFLEHWRFSEDDLQYLQQLRSPNHTPLFDSAFLNYLKTLRLSCDVDALLEGTVVFPQEPLIRITGPLLQAQLLESTLLNIINFQTLIATKSARVCQAAKGEPVLEFGMRRAQGPDGALSASRAAYIGGCAATSNVLAGKRYDIPVRGTQAHSWITAFPDEMSAFEAYAEVMPDNCILLVDTYDTIQGVKNAIKIGEKLKSHGKPLHGIRLDSGDLYQLSVLARKQLDQAGFKETAILASNNLDEYVIADLKKKGAPITLWGVGTRLSTAYDQPALDGVYKLSALREEKGKWIYKLKLSEQAIKISNPGIHQVRRFFVNRNVIADMIYDIELGASDNIQSLHPPSIENKIVSDHYVDLLEPIFRNGKYIAKKESIHILRTRTLEQTAAFSSVKNYFIGLEKKLYDIKHEIIEEHIIEKK